jgi:hypothetical protein
MPTISPDEQKALIKEALQDWLDAKYAEVGKWTVRGIIAVSLVLLISFSTAHGMKLEDFIKP